MLELFTALTEMLYAAWWVSLLSAFLWGVLSVILSPCHLSTIPLVVGFINDRSRMTRYRAFALSFLFSSGILITLALIGVITGLAGRIIGDIGVFGNYVVGILLILFGIYLMDFIRLPFLQISVKPTIRRKGRLSAFLLGLIFGIVLGPCSFAFMASILGIVFNTAADNIVYAVSLLGAYAVGHCLVIVLAGTFTEVVKNILKWNEKSKGTMWIKRVCGVLIILAAGYLILSTLFQ